MRSFSHSYRRGTSRAPYVTRRLFRQRSRITMPVSLEEYRIGQAYMRSRMQMENTRGSEGVEVVASQPFSDDRMGAGHMAHVIYHFHSKAPAWLRALAPHGALCLEEQNWNAYPRSKTVLKCPYLTKFAITIESIHLADRGDSENALGLSEEQLKQRKVERVDIASHERDMWTRLIAKSGVDPSKLALPKAKRGPLAPGWQDAPKAARDGVKALYETKSKTREQKRVAEVSAIAAVSGAAGESKKSRMTDFYGDESACKKNSADESTCLAFAALRLPEHHTDHPLWLNMVSCIARAGDGYVAPRRRFIGGVGLQKCRKRIESALAPIASSWRRDGVTVSSDMMTDRNHRPHANVLLINDSGAAFMESVDRKMEQKTGGYIASLLRPILKKLGPENVVAFCMDGGSNYAVACKELMEDYPHIEHVPCATDVLDLMMEDVGKMDWAKNLVSRGNEIITFTASRS
ncbi:unnamed protein product [Closterium sp. NIES-53]